MVLWAGLTSAAAGFAAVQLVRAVRVAGVFSRGYAAGRALYTGGRVWRISRAYKTIQLARRHLILATLAMPIAVMGQTEMIMQTIENWPLLRADIIAWHQQRFKRRDQVRTPHYLQMDSDDARFVNLVYTSRMLGIPLSNLIEQHKVAMRSESYNRMQRASQRR